MVKSTSTKASPSQPSTKTSPPSSNDGAASRLLIERIRKPSAQLRRLGGLIYARTKVGKTSTLLTMPGKGLVVDIPQIEGGTCVLAGARDDIDVLPVTTWGGMKGAPEGLVDVYPMLRHGSHDYKWVAIDTITGCRLLAKRKVVGEHDDTVAGAHQLTQQDWGKIGELLSNFIVSLRLLPIHVIFLAQEKIRTNAGITVFEPSLTPSALDTLLPSLHLVGRMYMYETDEGKWIRQMRVGPHAAFSTGVRAVPGRELAPVIREPNLGQIFAYLMGENVKAPTAGFDESSILDFSEESDED